MNTNDSMQRPARALDATEAARLWATAAHFSAAFVSFAGPLLVSWLRRDEIEREPEGFLRRNVGESLSFEAGVFVAWLVTLPISLVPCIGWIPPALILAANAVLSLIGGIHAYDGREFHYPVGWDRLRAVRRSPRDRDDAQGSPAEL